MCLGIKLLLPAAPQCPSRGWASQPVVSLPLDCCGSHFSVQTELFTHIFRDAALRALPH